MRKIEITPGDTVVRLAAATGFAPDTIWNHPGNAELKATRDHMDVLAAGDELTIPDLVPKSLPAATGKRYRYRRHGVPMNFILQLLDAMGKPRAGRPYRLVVDGSELAGVTDSAGVLEHYLPNASKEGELYLDELKLKLLFGVLEPREDLLGLQQRLSNLGSNGLQEGEQENPATTMAANRFQRLMGFTMTGVLDTTTGAALQTEHQQIGSLAQKLAQAQEGT